MSNLCSNILIIKGQSDIVHDFSKLAYENEESVLSLDKLVDIHQFPERNNAHLHYWGTNYIHDITLSWQPQIKFGQRELHYQFSSANSPPAQAVIHFSKKFPALTFYLNFEEMGCDFIGSAHIKNGKVISNQTHSFSDYHDSDIVFEKAHVLHYEKDVTLELALKGYYLYYPIPELATLHQYDFKGSKEQSSFTMYFDYAKSYHEPFELTLDDVNKEPNFLYEGDHIEAIQRCLEEEEHPVHRVIQNAYLDYTLPVIQEPEGHKTFKI
jgi:hypothetical protein